MIAANYSHRKVCFICTRPPHRSHTHAHMYSLSLSLSLHPVFGSYPPSPQVNPTPESDHLSREIRVTQNTQENALRQNSEDGVLLCCVLKHRYTLFVLYLFCYMYLICRCSHKVKALFSGKIKSDLIWDCVFEATPLPDSSKGLG